MSWKAYWAVGVALVVATAVASAIAYPQLPPWVVVHWNIHGKPDGYGPKEWSTFVMPAVMAGFVGLFAILPWLSPRKFEVDTFRSTYLFVMVVTLGLFAYMHFVMLYAAMHPSVEMGRFLVAGIFLFFIVLGNVLGKVRRNFWIGVRVPWTLASERVWNDTHRVAAWTFVAGGAVGFVLSLLGWLVPALVAMIVWCLVPVIYSFVRYKQLERAGELGEAVES